MKTMPMPATTPMLASTSKNRPSTMPMPLICAARYATKTTVRQMRATKMPKSDRYLFPTNSIIEKVRNLLR